MLLPLIETPERRDFPSPQESDMTAKKKAAKKTTTKKVTNGNGAAKGPGVIATVIATISREKGASADECLEILKGKFPDRDPDGMRRTVLIQANKNKSSTEMDEKRGKVYFNRR
jgi:hypothetical protein